MTIREYIETLDEEEQDEMAYTLYQISQDDPEDFENWCHENDVDMEAIDETTGEYVLTLWVWDMCGD